MPGRLRTLVGKARLALRIWVAYVRVRYGLARMPLPRLTEHLGSVPGGAPAFHPLLLSRAVDRALRLGSIRPRCLTSSLVLYGLLREQGDAAVLVIGLPREARDHNAHAWVEFGGHDVGPPPGRGAHVEFARFGDGDA